MARFKADKSDSGDEALELRAGQIHYKNFSRKYQIPVPDDEGQLVFRRHNQIIIKPGGFLLWQTHEVVGTPEENVKTRAAELLGYDHYQTLDAQLKRLKVG